MNGQPVVAAMLSKFYAWDFHQKVGLSADQMWRQVQSAGYLGVQGNWFSNPDGSSPREQFLWDQYRLFFYGPATQDIGRSKDAWSAGLNTSQGRALIADIVNFHKRKPYLLFWLVVNEYNPDAMPVTQYRPVHDYIRSLDPSRLTGDIYVLAGSEATRSSLYQIGGMILPEISIDQSSIPEHPFGRLLGELLLQERLWQQGYRFVRGVSTTPIGEFIPMGVHPCGDHRASPYPYVELERWYLTQVALNARAFEVLWGPSQTEGGCSPSQTPWGSWSRVMEVWNWQLTLVRHLTSTLRPVILSPTSFARIQNAAPAFEEPSQSNGFVYRGVYAAQKQVSGTTYVVVVNTQSQDLQNVVVPVSGSAAVDVLSGERFSISAGQLRWSAFPALKARILTVAP
ncbi:hypothetical protein HRbin32_00408 [bacterium HR32]|nr:hypothetical protein HRbin32_00408 [bacterium HR32]